MHAFLCVAFAWSFWGLPQTTSSFRYETKYVFLGYHYTITGRKIRPINSSTEYTQQKVLVEPATIQSCEDSNHLRLGI